MELAPESQLWSVWLVRGILMLSTLCQIILTLFGSERHRIKNRGVRLLVWLTYMGANWAGTYLLGSMSAITSCYEDTNLKGALRLFSFWAPFILFHFAGPDTITAYSLEDNELWLRSCLKMFGNVGLAIYILLRYWSNDILGYLSILILLIGIVKYIEWILSLRSKSKQHLERHNYITHIRKLEAYVNHKNTLFYQAYLLYCVFAYQFGKLEAPSPLEKAKRSLLRSKTPEDAFKLVQIELKLIYQVFYTKATVFWSVKGLLVRCICFISLVATLPIFLSVIFPRSSYQTIDIAITYILLTGAIFLEGCSFIILFSSDWRKLWLVLLKLSWLDKENIADFFFGNEENTWLPYSLVRFFRTQQSQASQREIPPTPLSSLRNTWEVNQEDFSHCDSCFHSVTEFSCLNMTSRNRGWMGQYNLISSCFEKQKASNKHCFVVRKLLTISEELEKQPYVRWEKVTPDLQQFIFQHVVIDAIINVQESWTERYKRVLTKYRIDGCFLRMLTNSREPKSSGADTFQSDFGNSILCWHIATDICYHNHKKVEGLANKTEKLMDICMRVSDYILYLYLMRPSMISPGKSETVYPKICDDLIEIIEKELASFGEKLIYEHLIGWEGRYGETTLGHSYLQFGCRVAGYLDSMKEWNKNQIWLIISELWGEILGYAAIHCELNEHVQQLRRGGELLTYVRLLISNPEAVNEDSDEEHESRIARSEGRRRRLREDEAAATRSRGSRNEAAV